MTLSRIELRSTCGQPGWADINGVEIPGPILEKILDRRAAMLLEIEQRSHAATAINIGQTEAEKAAALRARLAQRAEQEECQCDCPECEGGDCLECSDPDCEDAACQAAADAALRERLAHAGYALTVS